MFRLRIGTGFSPGVGELFTRFSSRLSKWDIFHCVDAVLHHPEYRHRHAANLRRELPRIPFVGGAPANASHSEPASAGEESAVSAEREEKQIPRFARNDRAKEIRNDKEISAASALNDLDVFRAFVAAGRRLADLHVNYLQQPEYPLTKTEKPGEKLDWRVTKMRLSKDKTTLIYNER